MNFFGHHLTCRYHGLGLSLSIFLVSCGAPLKTADQVRGIFANTEQLNQKVGDLCNVLRTRQQSPSLTGIGLANDVCTKAGSRPLNYASLQKTLGFSVVDTDNTGVAPGANTKLFTIRTRSELWLNHSLLEIATVLLNQLKNETNSLLGSGGNGQSKNKDFSFKVIGKPVFDLEKWQLSLQFSISTTKAQNGYIDLNNTFQVNGIFFDKKYFAAVAETVDSTPVEKSLMESGKFLIVLVPHAGDIYLDLTSDIRLHSFGVDSQMKTILLDALGPGLKSIPDLLTGLINDAAKNNTSTTATTTATSTTLTR